MADTSISELMFTMTSLLFLLLGVVLVASILMSTVNPYEQITFANAEKLRAAMDSACATGEVVDITFNMPQNVPSFTGIFTVMPIWLITTNGDPNYVLYYESFPPGDAVGWETYQNMQNRLITQIPEGFEGGEEDVAEFARQIASEARSRGVNNIEGVIINNIVIDERKPVYYLGESRDFGETGQPVAYGKWVKINSNNNEPSGGDNKFEFNNYLALNTFEKSAIKYLPCGDNSLCLKTRSGVHTFPLSSCNNIQHVQLVYDQTVGGGDDLLKEAGFATGSFVGGTVISLIPNFLAKLTGLGIIIGSVGDFVRDVAVTALGIKSGEFAVASPCSMKEVSVEYVKGSCQDFIYEDSLYIDNSYNPCTEILQYPLYRYDQNTGNLVSKGSRTICLEKIGEGLDDITYPSYPSDNACLRVFVKNIDTDSYCWTPDPFKEASGDNWIFNKNELISAFSDLVSITPIKDNSNLIGDENKATIVLGPTDIALKRGEELYGALDRKWWWGWPG